MNSPFLDKPLRSFEQMVVEHAEKQAAILTRALIGRIYFNVYERAHGQVEAEPFMIVARRGGGSALDEAAVDAIEDGDYAYTVLVDIGPNEQRVRLLDLTDHGRAVLDEREEQERTEAKHAATDSLGAGRKVL